MATKKTDSAQWFEEAFGRTPIMAILRGAGIEQSLRMANTAWDLGIDAVEVTIQSDSDVEALAAVVDAGKNRGKQVGAGTVMSLESVQLAADSGAAFTVSPGFDLRTIRASEAAGMPSLPGVATASEVQKAWQEGLAWVKAFPAAALGTSWFTAMKGPFPEINFIATGGMNAVNAAEFLSAGVAVVAVGSALSNPSELPKLAEALNR